MSITGQEPSAAIQKLPDGESLRAMYGCLSLLELMQTIWKLEQSIRCSECGLNVPASLHNANFCPWCAAAFAARVKQRGLAVALAESQS